ncbi:uncharacterized protein PHALS_15122 [Plasmopara halstedii]|uniref:Uncharacterized protein n=1 Tax=Plasmopara halstedii TaxID=4781 RepID=A0A0N7L470_PLAHL|nr:uncharacterized protein PHALS_15122 [Plasmopara halstedii]CEG37851.1 hypothetical protein PHALS_15122 [Plasmopara halstedii]|eukprot:XP_024574220.1 hypothetical protein PHALS_15122 [Plasmopara halstedii]
MGIQKKECKIRSCYHMMEGPSTHVKNLAHRNLVKIINQSARQLNNHISMISMEALILHPCSILIFYRKPENLLYR